MEYQNTHFPNLYRTLARMFREEYRAKLREQDVGGAGQTEIIAHRTALAIEHHDRAFKVDEFLLDCGIEDKSGQPVHDAEAP